MGEADLVRKGPKGVGEPADAEALRRALVATTAELQLDERRLQALHALALGRFDREEDLWRHALEAASRVTASEVAWLRRAGADRSDPVVWRDGGRRALPGEEAALRARLTCPVHDGERTLATLAVAREGGVFDEGDARFLQVLADAALGRALRLRADEERRRLEAAMQHAQKLESLGLLTGGIAHDLNNLLSSVLGNLDVALADLAGDGPDRAALADARGSARGAADLVRQLLAYAGRARFHVQPVDLGELVREMGRLLRVALSKRARLTFSPSEPLPTVEADVAQLRQVVMNLLVNASDALGEEGGEITLSTGVEHLGAAEAAAAFPGPGLAEGRYAWVEVADTGCGMDASTRDRIFDPYFSTKQAGRGLGLAAVLGIVRSHRGAIRVASAPARGTTFRVLLPVPARVAASPAEREGPAPGWRIDGRVLVVDGEDAVRAVAARLLSRLGLTAVAAADGRSALEALRADPRGFDLVLLDLGGPGPAGAETLRELRRLRPGQRVVMTSGDDGRDVAERLAAAGGAAFAPKPLELATLAAAVRTALDG